MLAVKGWRSLPSEVRVAHLLEVEDSCLSFGAHLNGSASLYTGTIKTVVEQGYAQALGIWDSGNNALRAGCTLTSSAARRNSAVTFSSQMPSTVAVSTVTQTSLSTAVAASAAAASIAAPTVSGVQTATISTSSPSSSDDDGSKVGAIIGGLVGTCVLIAIIVGMYMCFCSGEKRKLEEASATKSSDMHKSAVTDEVPPYDTPTMGKSAVVGAVFPASQALRGGPPVAEA